MAAFLIAILLPLFIYLTGDPADQVRNFWALRIAEQFSPLLGIAICSNILSMEWENRTADIWLTKSYPRSGVLLLRLSVAAALTVLSVLLLTGQLYLTYVHFDWAEMLLVAIPGAIFLGTMGMLTGTALKNSAAAYIIPLGYWVFEMTTKGKYTGSMYLFSRTSIICEDVEDICIAIAKFGPWMVSKLLILALTACVIFITAFILQRAGRKWLLFTTA
ncbi:MAG: hypothetical protein ABIJ39_02630 [Chloroflexota bacterium]